jgi:hypothetical protein
MKKKEKTSLFFKKNHAVSEIVGTLILIVISVSTFSAVSIIVLNPWSNLSNVDIPQVLLVGSIHNDNVLIEHQGGVHLDSKTKITITIDNSSDTFQVNDFNYWIDLNSDGLWNVGEQIIYPTGNIVGKQVSCVIVDIEKNSIIFDKILQKGTSVFSPYLTVLPPDDVSETSAIMKMYYNFYNQSNFFSGSLNFSYGVVGGPYVNTASISPLSLDGWYGFQLNGLLSGTPYEYWSWMNCSNGSLFDGPLMFYTYQITRGLWHFDEAFGSTSTADAINPTCNGTVSGATFITNGKINNSLNFTGTTNYVDVPHHPKFNLTNEITIEAWLNVSKIGAQFPGNVSEMSSKNITDILGNSCFEPDLIHIAGTLYAIAYRDNASASLTTFRMDDDGVFLGTIDTKVISVPHFYEPTIINIHNNIYARAYGASDDQTEAKSHIVTLPVYGNGTIGDIIDIFDFPTYYGREANFINIAPGIYAVAIGGASFETYPTGYLVTVSIDDAGDIGSSLIDTLKFPLSSSCSEPSIVHIMGDIYGITYNGYGATAGIGYVITMHILSNGSIIEPLEETDQFGLPENGIEPTMIHVTNDIYAISYGSDSNELLRTGYIKTLSINSAGHVLNDSLDILPFYTYLSPIDYNFETDIMHVEGELYAVSFTGGNNSNWKRGFLTTVSITDTGNISDAALFIYEFDGRTALGGTSALNLASYVDRLIVVYGSINSTDRGFLTMEKIDLLGQEKSIIQKGDAFALMVNYDLLTARMTIGNTTCTVSGTVPFDSWTRIDLTYGGGFLKLYVNDVIHTGGSQPCTGQIRTNTDHLLFGGGLYGSIDEIKIFRGIYGP